MSGEELKTKLEGVSLSNAEIARQLGVFPQSFNKTLQSKDVSSTVLENIAKIIGKDMSFFYGGASLQVNEELEKANNEIENLFRAVQQLQEENSRLKSEIIHLQNPERDKTESEIYRLWMEHMKITERMQELYKSQKEG